MYESVEVVEEGEQEKEKEEEHGDEGNKWTRLLDAL